MPPPPPPPPGILDVAVSADRDINPDAHNRPSPVVLTLYQLSAQGEFLAGDYFELTDGKQIARDLVARDELSINPGEHKSQIEPVKQATLFLGVVASFQAIDRARWRSVISVPVHGTTKITIHLAGTVVSAQSDSFGH